MNRLAFLADAILLLTVMTRPISASPVLIRFSGKIEVDNCVVCTISDPFGGFLAVGDPFEATIHYDPATAVVFRSHQDSTTLTTYFSLSESSMTVLINGQTFENDPTEPLQARVGSWQTVSIFNIDARLVPHTDNGVPEQPGPQGVTELGFALQDNSGAAFGTLFNQMPEAVSPIFDVQLARLNFIRDTGGYCSLGVCYEVFPEGNALSDELQLTVIAVPEPSSGAILLVAAIGMALIWTRHVGQHRMP